MLKQDEQATFFSALRADRRALACVAAVLALGLASKLIHLQIPGAHYFDEVYHGFTAQQYVEGNGKAYDPWANPPQGFAYEWTHPPLAKLLMAGFMALFGEKFFWMRFGSAFFGTLAVFFTGWAAFAYFRSLRAAVFAMTLLSLETLHFAQSRIAMNDSYFVFFMLATIVLYLRLRAARGIAAREALFTGAMAGLALGTKWTGFYLIGIIGADQVFLWWSARPSQRLSHYLARALIFAGAAAAAYVLCYAHYFAMDYSWSQFEELQRQMWWYHNGLKATHSYQSKPWQWILNIKPVWMYVDYSQRGKVGNIYNAGNSVVLLGGAGAVLYLLGRAARKMLATRRFDGPGFFLFCYFALWLPWVFSPRIMLFYHYLPAVPFLCILLAHVMDVHLKQPLRRWAILGAALIWFAIFYPYATGFRVSSDFAEGFYYRIFPR